MNPTTVCVYCGRIGRGLPTPCPTCGASRLRPATPEEAAAAGLAGSMPGDHWWLEAPRFVGPSPVEMAEAERIRADIRHKEAEALRAASAREAEAFAGALLSCLVLAAVPLVVGFVWIAALVRGVAAWIGGVP